MIDVATNECSNFMLMSKNPQVKLRDSLCAIAFMLMISIYMEKNENGAHEKSSGGFTQKSSEMMESAGCSTRAPQLTIKKYYTEKVSPSFVHLPLLAFSFYDGNE